MKAGDIVILKGFSLISMTINKIIENGLTKVNYAECLWFSPGGVLNEHTFNTNALELKIEDETNL